MNKKVVNDAVAYIASSAEERGRTFQRAVRESGRSRFDHGEGRRPRLTGLRPARGGPRPPSLKAIDGRVVMTLLPEARDPCAQTARPTIPMSFRDRFLRAHHRSNIAYILMLVGILGIFFELSNPGAILPGVIGGISLSSPSSRSRACRSTGRGAPDPLRAGLAHRRDQDREPRYPHDRGRHLDGPGFVDALRRAGDRASDLLVVIIPTVGATAGL